MLFCVLPTETHVDCLLDLVRLSPKSAGVGFIWTHGLCLKHSQTGTPGMRFITLCPHWKEITSSGAPFSLLVMEGISEVLLCVDIPGFVCLSQVGWDEPCAKELAEDFNSRWKWDIAKRQRSLWLEHQVVHVSSSFFHAFDVHTVCKE